MSLNNVILKVDTNKLDSAYQGSKSTIGKSSEAYETTNLLIDAIDELNTMWTGDASAAFQSKMLECADRIMKDVQMMDQLTEKVQKSKNKYDGVEKKVVSIIDAIDISVNV